MKVIFCVDVEM